MTKSRQKKLTYSYQQSGVALVVGLVLLVVITLIAISGLTNASMQSKLSSATSQQNMMFQTAESSLSMMLNQMNGVGLTPGATIDLSPLNQVLNAPGQAAQNTSNVALSANSLIDANVKISFMSKNSVAPGFSLNADESSTTISPYTFKLEGKAEMIGSGASATIEKGIVYE